MIKIKREKLIRLRLSLGLTQADLALNAKLAMQVVNGVESRGRFPPSLKYPSIGESLRINPC